MKKSLVFVVFVSILISISLTSAIDLQISKKPINDVVISEFKEPAVFEFTITNLGASDNFQIYSLVGVDVSPKESFYIASGETKTILVSFYPNDVTKKRTLSFVYKIKGANSGIQEEVLTIDILGLQEAIKISTYNLNPQSDSAILVIENKVNSLFPEMKIKFDSAFFSTEKTLSLNSYEKKEYSIPLDKEKVKKLVAGEYILTGNIEVGNVKQTIEGKIKFVEQEGIVTKDSTSGIIFRQRTIEKTNEGNLPSVAEVNLKKDIISRLFTTFNVPPDTSERNGLIVRYSWFKELRPSEQLKVEVRTNYLYPLFILAIILLGSYVIVMYNNAQLSVKKRVNFVKTKGGEFALKVTVSVSTRNYVEKITVVDRLPPMSKLYEKFGAYSPDQIDEKNRRLIWNIESLQPGEERIFSYIVYSKVGVVGRFELPETTAVYEKEGKMHEATSNRAYFVNEPMKNSEE